MSKGDYPYPDDEFDAPADPDGPHGVHRAPRSAWRRWWPFLAVIVVVPAIAYGLVTYATRDRSTVEPGAGASVSQGAGDATDGTTATDGASASPSVTNSDDPNQGDDQPSASPTAVLGTPVSVVNAAKISGLATVAAKKLTTAGFTQVSTANGDKGSLTTSTVYYTDNSLAATADTVAHTLGLTAVKEDATKGGDGITVVLVAKLPS